MQCKIYQVTGFLLGELVHIFRGSTEGYFTVYFFVLVNTKCLAHKIYGWIRETELHALGSNMIPAEKEVSPHMLPGPLYKQLCHAQAALCMC